mmetsp:Transcript_12173/g.36679  ORF Transcript_12173/g.36679 Transcript_12173/m.36679 type:complete len:98 (-) Transcript_12173:562-855(-)
MSCQMAAISVYRKCFSVWHAWFGTKFQDKIEEKVLEYITNHSNYESDGNHWGEADFCERFYTKSGTVSMGPTMSEEIDKFRRKLLRKGLDSAVPHAI